MSKLNTITGICWIAAAFLYIAGSLVRGEFIWFSIGIIHGGIGNLYLVKADSHEI